MKNPSTKLTMLGVVLSLLFVTACGQFGGGADEEDDSPEAQVLRYRQSMMRIMAYKMGTIGAMARGEAPVDEAVFVKYVGDLATVAGMVGEGFMPETQITSIFAGTTPFIELGSNAQNLASIEWDADIPPGTDLILRTRTGDTVKRITHYYKKNGEEYPGTEEEAAEALGKLVTNNEANSAPSVVAPEQLYKLRAVLRNLEFGIVFLIKSILLGRVRGSHLKFSKCLYIEILRNHNFNFQNSIILDK